MPVVKAGRMPLLYLSMSMKCVTVVCHTAHSSSKHQARKPCLERCKAMVRECITEWMPNECSPYHSGLAAAAATKFKGNKGSKQSDETDGGLKCGIGTEDQPRLRPAQPYPCTASNNTCCMCVTTRVNSHPALSMYSKQPHLLQATLHGVFTPVTGQWDTQGLQESALPSCSHISR